MDSINMVATYQIDRPATMCWLGTGFEGNLVRQYILLAQKNKQL
jgi:hypothetical protein